MDNGFDIIVSSSSKTPFLSIVTRHLCSREDKIVVNKESVKNQIVKNYEQIFIYDTTKNGMLNANKSFSLVTDVIKGKYVHLLDDDDFYVNNEFSKRIEELAITNNYPDFIFFKMIIVEKYNTNDDHLFPKPDCWENKPIACRIGGSCFVCKKEIYQKYIHHFGVYPMGDFNFLNEAWKDNPSRIWHDELMCEARCQLNGN